MSHEHICIQPGFRTSQGAIFVATLDELVVQLPGWRLPLEPPERRTITNPFTGERIPDVLTRDPGPITHPAIPTALTFSCVLLPPREDWEQNFLALDLAISEEPPLTDEAWEDEWFDMTLERGLRVEPLLGGDDEVGDPRFLYEVPRRMFECLARLGDDGVTGLADAWTERCREPADAPAEYLAQFAALAREALPNGADLFTWNVHPLHRERSG